MAARVGIAWGHLGRDSDPASWVVVRASDAAILAASSSQGGALRLAHAMYDELDASVRLPGPTIVLCSQTSGDVRAYVCRRARADEAAQQIIDHTGTLRLRLDPALLERLHRLRGDAPLEVYILGALSRLR